MSYQVKVIADSIGPFRDRITTLLVTMPRIVLAELNTHRMLSRNSASSRAIPFPKMSEMVTNNPFVPMKWMKNHSGMQGTEYFDGTEVPALEMFWKNTAVKAVLRAQHLAETGLTKQICNRLLEPFMWTTVLITATEMGEFLCITCRRRCRDSLPACGRDDAGSHEYLGT